MPSHIFARVGLWQDDINSNLASIAATRKTAAMHMGGEGHQFHAMDFLFYAYLQSGREADARKLIEKSKPCPKMHDMYGVGFRSAPWPLKRTSPRLYPTRNARLGRPPRRSRRWQFQAPPADSTGLLGASAIGAAHLHQTDGSAQRSAARSKPSTRNLSRRKRQTLPKAAEDDLKQAQAWLALRRRQV